MTRTFTLVAGVVFLVAGVLGFIPEITVSHVVLYMPGTNGGHEYLLGIFAVDTVHNLINLVIGALGIAAYYRDQGRLYCQGVGIVCLLIGILGFIPALVLGNGMVLGLFHVNLADNVVYVVVGAVAAYFGFAPRFGGERVSPTH
jgi:Domain of unknown function (DUF4383)